MASWNAHVIRPRRGRPSTGGRPDQRKHDHPHPGGQLHLPAYVIARYEDARGQFVHHVPAIAWQGDPLFHWPNLRARRAAAVGAIMGSDPNLAWSELLAGSYVRFISAYQCFLG